MSQSVQDSVRVIERIDLFRLKIPLTRPYVLSFGRLEFFHSLVCRMVIDGVINWGETTPLPGYGPETIDEAWDWSVRTANRLVGKTIDQSISWLENEHQGRPFRNAAIATSLEYHQATPWLCDSHRIPAVKGVGNSSSLDTIETITRCVEDGYRTIKLKYVGELDDYLQWIHVVLSGVPADVSIRIDANQALDLEAAERLWKAIDDSRVEYLEQPFQRGDWESLNRFFDSFPEARICLDESIWEIDDIERCVDMDLPLTFKLKLMKAASPTRLIEMVERIRKAGKRIIFGNGVQSDVGTLTEFAMYRRLGLETAAEFNGFARQKMAVIDDFPIRMETGNIVLDSWDGEIVINKSCVEQSYRVEPRGSLR